jgi:hypothetical protein
MLKGICLERVGLPICEKVKSLFWLFFTLLAGSFVIVVLQSLLEDYGYIPIFKHLKSNPLYSKYSSVSVVFISIVVAPIFEEYTFRGFLKVTRVNVSLSVALLVYVITSFVYKGIYIMNEVFLLKLGILTLSFFLTYSLLRDPAKYERVKNFIQINFLKLFVLSAIMFAYAHIFNFGEITFEKLLYSPVFLFQVFYFGLVAGYARIKFGIVSSILLHSLFNGYLELNDAIINYIKG